MEWIDISDTSGLPKNIDLLLSDGKNTAVATLTEDLDWVPSGVESYVDQPWLTFEPTKYMPIEPQGKHEKVNHNYTDPCGGGLPD
jgi:hypothetical protein